MEAAATRARYNCASWIITPLTMYPRKTWSTWALSPLWILQMLLSTDTIIVIGILIFEVEGQGTEVDVGWVVALAFMFICILLTAAEIGLWYVRALHPWTFLGIQVFKSTFWLLYFCVGMATTVAQRVVESDLVWTIWKIWQAVGMSLAFVVTIAALVYGAVVVHRYRKGRTYGQTEDEKNEKAGGDVDDDPPQSPVLAIEGGEYIMRPQ